MSEYSHLIWFIYLIHFLSDSETRKPNRDVEEVHRAAMRCMAAPHLSMLDAVGREKCMSIMSIMKQTGFVSHLETGACQWWCARRRGGAG
jgi:hypothetical protein